MNTEHPPPLFTLEQLKRIQEQKERAFRLRQEKQQQQLQQELQLQQPPESITDTNPTTTLTHTPTEELQVLEDFEIEASTHITKEQAMKMYCLPQSTIEMCSFVVKDNPKCNKFAPMKLYSRQEVRKRARDKYGGIQGLQKEREERQMKRLQRDLQSSQDLFTTTGNPTPKKKKKN